MNNNFQKNEYTKLKISNPKFLDKRENVENKSVRMKELEAWARFLYSIYKKKKNAFNKIKN